MNLWKIAAAMCFVAAAVAIGAGLTLTAGLIEEYGHAVSPLQLTAQAAVAWLPAAALLIAIGLLCFYRGK